MINIRTFVGVILGDIFMNLKRKNMNMININDRSDVILTAIFIIISVICYYYYSRRSIEDMVFLASLIWYFVVNLYITKIKIFSGLGLFIVYLFCYVQIGYLMQDYYSYYESLSKVSQNIIMMYNFIMPVIIYLGFNKKKIKVTELKQVQYQRSWIFLLFLAGVAAISLFFLSVGSIPLFASDGENFRVEAVQGRGFLVIIAATCFQVSTVLAYKKTDRIMFVMVGVPLLLGTGFRSSALSLILLSFLVYQVGYGRRFLLKSVFIVIFLLFLYALIGVIRSSTNWQFNTLYMPIMWRFYVNSSNFNMIVERYPINELQLGLSFFKDFSVILPGAQKSFMLQLKDIMNVYFAGGSITPTVFGEGYYNWGLIGAILWPILVTWFIANQDYKFKKRYPAGIYYILAFSIAGFSTTSLASVCINTIIPVMLVYYVLTYLNRHYKLRVFGRRKSEK